MGENLPLPVGLNTWDCFLIVSTHCNAFDIKPPGRKKVQGIPDASTNCSFSRCNPPIPPFSPTLTWALEIFTI
jgi:hypothetical protein